MRAIPSPQVRTLFTDLPAMSTTTPPPDTFEFDTLAGRYRMPILDVWTESGALAWAATLPRVPAPKRDKSARGKTAKKGRDMPASLPLAGAAEKLDETTLLQSLARHGYAVAAQ